MKKVILKTVPVFILTLSMISCGGSKQVAQTTPSTPPTPSGFGTEITTPCVDASYDDSDFFRGLGTGTSTNIGNARGAALRAAQSEINSKLGGFVSGLSTDYSRTMAGESGEKTQRAMEGELNKVVEKMLNDASKTCEKTLQDQRGAFNTFIVLKIPKAEMLEEMENALSDNEELKIEFNREQFRKYADEKMKAMKEAQSSR